jgi:hypothetical protein
VAVAVVLVGMLDCPEHPVVVVVLDLFQLQQLFLVDVEHLDKDFLVVQEAHVILVVGEVVLVALLHQYSLEEDSIGLTELHTPVGVVEWGHLA